MGANKFPLDVFPKELQELITELKRTNNFAEEFTALSILYAVGLAVGNSMHVQAKKTWNVNMALWVIFVARSGLGKSPPMKFIFAPFYDRDRELNKQFNEELKEYEEYEMITYRKNNYYMCKNKVYEIIKDEEGDDDVGECVGDWVKQKSGKFKLVKN